MADQAHDTLPLSDSSYERGQVLKIISSVLSKVHEAEDVQKESLLKELSELTQIVEDSRKELGAARPSEISLTHIPNATDELNAIVGATEEATGTIMDSCEVIQGLMPQMDTALSGQVGSAVNSIFEACSFQDITGQRITKVINTLVKIEQKVAQIMDVVGPAHGFDGDGVGGAGGGGEEVAEGDAALLNGPQLPGQGVTQDDIDKLLAEFD